MKLFDTTLNLLSRSLDVRLERHNVLSSDLANAETPNYAPRDVDFKAAMQQATLELETQARAQETGLPVASPGPTPELVGPAAGAAAGLDGNKVDSDHVLVALGENGLQYSASARAAGKKLAILRYVASDGNG
jgi:flagellar basal-body rod protein FlgB